MLLTFRFPWADRKTCSDPWEHFEEFWFGRGFAWAESAHGRTVLGLSLLVDVPRIVARTRRRDREERLSVGFCDAYPYTATGLMALFVARLPPLGPFSNSRGVELEFVAYPARPYAAEIARRLFLPAGYSVRLDDGRLCLQTDRTLLRVVRELPALLLALDRRTRLFLSAEELREIADPAADLVCDHPARRAIELAISGEQTPLRFLLPPGSSGAAEKSEEASAEYFRSLEVHSDHTTSSQQDRARGLLARVNIDPKWLIYLPAAIASAQSPSGSELESPEGALAYFRDEKIEKAIVEEKHMGSRGIVIVCKTLRAARERFGTESELPGCAYTRNGRRFFRDEDTEAVFLSRLESALSRANFWRRFSTDWVCFDGEILPWAVKASEGSEESSLVEAGVPVIRQTLSALSVEPDSSAKTYWKSMLDDNRAALENYDSMYKRYRSQSADLAALKFAPFHLLAVEGSSFFDCSHLWHMQTLSRLARSGRGFVIPTRYAVVETTRSETWRTTLDWWAELSSEHAEGFVVKPFSFVPRGRRGLAQPALKCRSHEHLRLVYGPAYDSVESIEVLRSRGSLLRRRNKHRRILRQFSLSMEAVNRFVKRSPMDAVHECILGVLAQEVAPMKAT